MRSRRGKPPGEHQVTPERLVSQNEPARIIALTAQQQQFLIKAMRQI